MIFSDIKALVLAGGESTRMGMDKGDLVYRQKAQKFHVADMLTACGLDTYISIKNSDPIESEYKFIKDNYAKIGPMGGILTAFETYPTAWLIVGCDYPLLKKDDILKLLISRNLKMDATVYKDKLSNYAIPILGIYEYTMYEKLKNAQMQADFSLNRVLQQNSVNFVEVKGAEFESIDTPEAYQKIKKIIHEQYLP